MMSFVNAVSRDDRELKLVAIDMELKLDLLSLKLYVQGAHLACCLVDFGMV